MVNSARSVFLLRPETWDNLIEMNPILGLCISDYSNITIKRQAYSRESKILLKSKQALWHMNNNSSSSVVIDI